jgi:anti-sigma regulatory factor (Ser/Thr protein kinase)
VDLRAELHGRTLEVVVSDEGDGLPPPALRPRTGLGLAIIARAADGLEISDTPPGTRLRMLFAIG